MDGVDRKHDHAILESASENRQYFRDTPPVCHEQNSFESESILIANSDKNSEGVDRKW
jgi:hypothetical protein